MSSDFFFKCQTTKAAVINFYSASKSWLIGLAYSSSIVNGSEGFKHKEMCASLVYIPFTLPWCSLLEGSR